MGVSNHWWDKVKYKKMRARVVLRCEPKMALNIRAIRTTTGKIVEWQLPLNDPPELDYQSLTVYGSQPEPGLPVVTTKVIRFHVDDVEEFYESGQPLA